MQCPSLYTVCGLEQRSVIVTEPQSLPRVEVRVDGWVDETWEFARGLFKEATELTCLLDHDHSLHIIRCYHHPNIIT